jgi:glycyl-tRNA synthetase beta chain
VRSVLARGYDYAVDAKNRVSAVNKIRKHSDFESLATAFKRASNILKQAAKTGMAISDTINESLLTDEHEKQLYKDILSIEASIKESLDRKDYYEAMGKIVGIKGSVDNFFEKVLVMAEDVNVRANRLALLNYVLKPFYSILDFSMLQGPEK